MRRACKQAHEVGFGAGDAPGMGGLKWLTVNLLENDDIFPAHKCFWSHGNSPNLLDGITVEHVRL